MLTTKDRHDFLRAGEKIEDEAGTLVYYDSVSDQKRIGPPLYEPVSSWSDEVAQTASSSSRAHREKVEFSRLLPFSSLETVVQLLSLSQSPDAVVAIQDQTEYPTIYNFRAEDIVGCQCSIRSCLFTPTGHCLPLLLTSKSKHAARKEAANRSIVQGSIKATNKRVSVPGPAQSKKVDVPGVV